VIASVISSFHRKIQVSQLARPKTMRQNEVEERSISYHPVRYGRSQETMRQVRLVIIDKCESFFLYTALKIKSQMNRTLNVRVRYRNVEYSRTGAL
jgi:hypothetical protein